MSENSKIEWTDHTFNPWWGCMKVSDGCKNCYAETLDNRWKGGHWGPSSNRKAMSESYWAQPLKWNAAAKKAGVKAKVFCASMADVFEGHPETLLPLARLFELIKATQSLTWQLLTKRPENIMKLVPWHWLNWPMNVWIGASVEDQSAADKRIPHLLSIPADIRFLSCEPLLGPLDLSEYMILTDTNDAGTELAEKRGWGYDSWSGGFSGPGTRDAIYEAGSGIHWVIAGGESGARARPAHPDWVRSLREQCKFAQVPFFFKQWGEWWPGERGRLYQEKTLDYTDGQPMVKVGKLFAGRLLDTVEHNEFPQTIELI